ncbi:roadblock/LC7 domain-containing protein [Spirillospora sp. NPDC029432]|uniref:roadblock/LC7 domain-containing protein n=1 Tax=Spirillospora sp. NPDC029432 TaxID=3154599 RepID=UPI003453C4E9
MIERLANVAFHERIDGRGAAVPAPAVLAVLTALRARVPDLTGSVVASSDGLLIAHDLPDGVEPSGMAALTAAELALSHRMASTAHGGGFHEVVVHGTSGYVVVYSAGWSASLTVLSGPGVNVGRLHLESRPAARAIAALLAGARAPSSPSAAPAPPEEGTAPSDRAAREVNQ